MSRVEEVTYRFPMRDRTGWFLGLGAAQCIALGVGVLLAGIVLNSGLPGLLTAVPLVGAIGFAFGTWQGRPVHEISPTVLAWMSTQGSRRWTAPLPRWRADSSAVRSQPDFPPAMAGMRIEESEVAWTRRGRNEAAAVVFDDVEHTATVVMRITGREFSLCERTDQQRLLALWGDALAAFCTERGPVVRFRWTEWASPADLDEQLAYLANHQRAPDDDPAVATYRQLLDEAGPMSTRHEALTALTVSAQRGDRRGTSTQSTEEMLLEEARLLIGRLENAGLSVDLPLSPSEVARAIRLRFDPCAQSRSGAMRKSLAELAGLATVPNAGPLSVEAVWDHARVDGSFHAAYVIAEWPRLEVPPNWMEPLLLHAGGVRTIAVHYEPVPHSRSHRQVERDNVKLASDEQQREQRGFRVGARHRRAQTDIADREAELVAGFPEFEYIGTVHIAAPDADSRARSCSEYEQVAAQAGIELRRLDGQHDLALQCMLPIGRGIGGKRGLR